MLEVPIPKKAPIHIETLYFLWTILHLTNLIYTTLEHTYSGSRKKNETKNEIRFDALLM